MNGGRLQVEHIWGQGGKEYGFAHIMVKIDVKQAAGYVKSGVRHGRMCVMREFEHADGFEIVLE